MTTIDRLRAAIADVAVRLARAANARADALVAGADQPAVAITVRELRDFARELRGLSLTAPEAAAGRTCRCGTPLPTYKHKRCPPCGEAARKTAQKAWRERQSAARIEYDRARWRERNPLRPCSVCGCAMSDNRAKTCDGCLTPGELRHRLSRRKTAPAL